jgi:hypothetical protein
MATFPLLDSGAVTQYPTPRVTAQGVDVIRFMDGGDQRYLTQGRQFRQWKIRLDLLSEAEVQKIEFFFAAQRGEYATFVFPDPITGAAISNCRIGAPVLTTDYVGVDRASTSLWVVETNG